MKKKNFKSLSLKKKTVANLKEVKGGVGLRSAIISVTSEDTDCSVNVCNSGQWGCVSYTCP